MKAYHTFLIRGIAVVTLSTLVLNCNERSSVVVTATTKIDSLLVKAKDSRLMPEERLKNLRAAYHQNIFTKDDSLRMAYYSKISYLAASQSDTALFLDSGKNGMLLAKKRNDSLALGNVDWNYGIYFLERNKLDSSYFHYRKAYRFFQDGNDYYAGKMLYNMAFISGRLKEYTASENLLYQAIALFEKDKKYTQLYLCYNHLGVVHKNLGEYDEALRNYDTALNYWEKTSRNPIYYFDTQNNIGMVYQKTGNQKEAIEAFDRVVSNNEIGNLDPALYARILDNRSMSLLLLREFETLPSPFYKALQLRDSIGNQEGRVMSYIHLSQYYLAVKDTVKARANAETAFDLANKIDLKRDALDALLLLAKTNTEERNFYLKKHISLTEELNQEERKVRNKFARIHYETDSYIHKNERLERTRLWIVIGSIFLITILILIVVLLRQRSKNKALEFEVKQQQADEQIYLLTLKEIASTEKGKLDERRRISEELHDGILARILGIRLNWERLKLEGEREVIEAHWKLLNHLDLVEREIRRISHDLQNEIMLSDTRFIRRVEQLIKERADSGGFEYEYYADPIVDWEGFDDYFKTNIYRILEEALQNCIKHAEAKLVCVSLRKEGDFVVLKISDTGKGFTSSIRTNGIGLRNMKSRTKKLKGIFNISSEIGKGTDITVTIPNDDKL